jgi:hypothetical protein
MSRKVNGTSDASEITHQNGLKSNLKNNVF